MKRVLYNQIKNDLSKKMVILVGPRQSGKTYLAREIAKSYKNHQYLNCDSYLSEKIVREGTWNKSADLLIFDEVHKIPKWKNIVKGAYDELFPNTHILVTGSARLEAYHHFGESMAGRYFQHNMFPFSIEEIFESDGRRGIERLVQQGGFPEIYLSDDEIHNNRWRTSYFDGLIREDVFSLSNIHDQRALRILIEILKAKVSTPIVYENIRKNLTIDSIATVQKYIELLESLYLIFKIHPYSHNIERSIRKQPKIYFFDQGNVEDEIGKKFENFVALELFNQCVTKSNLTGVKHELRYVRKQSGQEVDFLVVRDGEPIHLVEAKSSDTTISNGLKYFKKMFPDIKATQVVYNNSQTMNIGNDFEICLVENLNAFDA